MHIKTTIIGENILYTETIYGFFLIQISTVQYCLKLQNIIYCIVNIKKHH